MTEKIIELSRKYEVPGVEPFDKVRLRAPTYKEIYMNGLGVPREVQLVAGKPVVLTHYDVIDQHLLALCQSPPYDALAHLEALDAMDVAEALIDFFTKAPASPKP